MSNIEMKKTIIRLKAFGYYLDTLTHATWRRCGVGVMRYMRFSLLMVRAVFLTAMGIIFFGKRAGIFMSAYAWFRRVDDIIDGDAPVPVGYSRESYIDERRQAMRVLRDGSNDVRDFLREDLLLFHIKYEAVRCGIDILEDIAGLWRVIEFELELRAADFLRQGMHWHYCAQMQDRVFFRLSGKIFGYNHNRLEELCEKMDGVFTELGWLRDLDHDLKNGIAAIPREAFHGVPDEVAYAIVQQARGKGFHEIKNNPHISRWYRGEAMRLFLQWEYMKGEFGNNFGGMFSNESFARFAQMFVERFVSKALDEVLTEARSLEKISLALLTL